MSKSVVRIHLLDFGGPTLTTRPSTDLVDRESMATDIEKFDKMVKEEKDKKKADELLKNFLQGELKKKNGDKNSFKDDLEEPEIEL